MTGTQILAVVYGLGALIVLALTWVLIDLSIRDEAPENRGNHELLRGLANAVPGGLPGVCVLLGLLWPFVVIRFLIDKPWRKP